MCQSQNLNYIAHINFAARTNYSTLTVFFGAKTEDPSPLSYFCTILEHCLPPSECKYFLNDPIVYTDFIVDFIHCDYLTKTKFLQEQKTDNLKNTLSYFAILFI